MAHQSSSPRFFFMAQFTLRILVAALSLTAVVITAFNKQFYDDRGVFEHFHYTNSAALSFQVGANAIVGALSSASLILVYALRSPSSHPTKYFQLFLHDTMMTMLMISGCAAGTVEMYLAKFGQGLSLWFSYCPHVEHFCHKMLISLLLSCLAFLCMFTVAIMDAYRLNV